MNIQTTYIYKLYIKGIEISKAEDLQGFQDQVDNLSEEFDNYQIEIDAAIEDVKEEVKQIVLEGGEADPIFITFNGYKYIKQLKTKPL